MNPDTLEAKITPRYLEFRIDGGKPFFRTLHERDLPNLETSAPDRKSVV